MSLLQEMGDAYEAAPRGQTIDTSELHSSHMPPFVGTDEELEALVATWWAVRRAVDGVDADTNAAIARWGWRWALWTTVLQVVDGFVLLALLPPPVLRGVMVGGAATLVPLGLAILLGIGLLMMLARTADPVQHPALVNGALGAMVLVIAVMSLTRHQV
ncbi:MAG TPA: hypothetical protein VLT32_07605, partial [Candidatus Sulfomarinibacteraceae bacterium]|nr:hypothetical protein [Candidatus Sulfomarinibacteraceae bacterium]